ncbi:hypothetical protein DITRI_Ditri04bG0017900 [Diplodiscus trichospermus]
MAIREDFILFLSSPWASNHAIEVECDYVNAVKWVSNPQSVPWQLRKWVAHIENLKKQTRIGKLPMFLESATELRIALPKLELGEMVTLWTFRKIGNESPSRVVDEVTLVIVSLCFDISSVNGALSPLIGSAFL